MFSHEEQNPVLTFGAVLACAAAIAAVVGLQMLCGFVVGVLVTLLAAALAGLCRKPGSIFNCTRSC